MRRHWSTPHAACVLMASAWIAGCSGETGNDPSGVGPFGSMMPTTGPLGTDPAAPVGPGDPTVGPVATGPNGMPIDPGPDATVPGPDATVPGPDATVPAGSETPVTPVPTNCEDVQPGRAPLRRLTRFEYNNTVSSLLGETSQPANALPPELLGNGFGNDADTQPVSFGLVEGYETIARQVVDRALASDPRFSCVASATTDAEAACTQEVLDSFATGAYRRTLSSDDATELLTLQGELRANGTYQESIADLMSTILQGPDFLYRFEWGEPDPANPALRRPTGSEMASRLSYFLWGTMPDDTLEAAASSGELSTAEGVLTQATRMLADREQSREVIRYFFDHALPINGVAELARDPEQYPMFSGSIGGQMREETQLFLENEIFEGEGTWKSALTANYVFVNETLANYYGITNPDGSPVTGEEYRRVDVDPQTTKRRGVLTQGAVLAGTTITNFTNPVRRGGFVVKELLCQHIPLPNDPDVLEEVAPPEPFEPGQAGRETARMRYEQHRDIDAVCITCHAVLDPPGFALENYDAVGLWRDQENGVTIDATGDIALLGGAFDGPLALVDKIAETERAYTCFSEHWTKFALGRNLDTAQDACLVENVESAFVASGYDIQDLLLQLTQTDAFLYLPAQEQL